MDQAERLTALRKQKGLSQAQLAEALDVSRQAVSRWEVGATLPSTENLLALRDLYGVTLDALLYEETPPPPQAGRRTTYRRCALLALLLAGAVLATALVTAHVVRTRDEAVFAAALAQVADDTGRIVFSETFSSGAGTWDSARFGTTGHEGTHLRVWFQNVTSEAATVYLWRTDRGADEVVAQTKVPGNEQGTAVYRHRAAEGGSYLLTVEATESGGLLAGTVSVMQLP